MDTRLGFSVTDYFGIPVTELIRIAVKNGFSAVSPTYSAHTNEDCMVARECGAKIQFLHAPIGKAADMWSRDEERRKTALNELVTCVECASKYEIPAMVVHTWIGFDNDSTPTREGLDAHSALVGRAEELGVKIAYENTEGIETLFALMEHFAKCDTVGFCWDSGHELCYNNGDDLLALLGDRLLVTHLDDNLGVTDPAGKTKCTDDYHLLPFDGKVDWARAIKGLRASKKQEFINFELKFRSCNVAQRLYASLNVDEYVAEAYKRATSILSMICSK